MPSLNLWCQSKTDAQLIQDGQKTVWSIPYVSVAFFQVLTRIILHIVLLKCQIAFSKFTSFDNQALVRVYSNCFCSCSFEAELIKMCQSFHKMYSNKILNFYESTTILNAHTKKVVCTLSYAPRIYNFILLSKEKDIRYYFDSMADISENIYMHERIISISSKINLNSFCFLLTLFFHLALHYFSPFSSNITC